MTLELRFCTIISNDGITIFHRTFVEDELDEYLFSGFSSAMIAFSKELGDSLAMIKMEKQTIFYHEATEDGFLILSITKGYEVNEVTQKIEELSRRDTLNLLLAGSRIGLVQNENEKFERDLFEIFNVAPRNKDSTNDVILEPATDDPYVPPASNMGIPQTAKKTKPKVKSLEEQLEDEVRGLEEYLATEKEAEQKIREEEEKELQEFLKAFD